MTCKNCGKEIVEADVDKTSQYHPPYIHANNSGWYCVEIVSYGAMLHPAEPDEASIVRLILSRYDV